MMKKKEKDNFLSDLKNILPITIIVIVASAMLFIYEPIITYISNINDYWFAYNTLINSSIKLFFVSFIILEAVSIIIYCISKITKKRIIYDVLVILFFSIFIIIYIQGNYLVGKLPILNGVPIVWKNYTTQHIISCVLITIVVFVNILLYKKSDNKAYKKGVSLVTLAVFVMLLTSFFSSNIFDEELSKKRTNYAQSMINYNNISNSKNMFILLVDCADAIYFDKILKEDKKERILEDFTYYPDTLAAYPFTRDALPFILTGEWNEAEKLWGYYFVDALSNSQLLKELEEREYEINIYDDDHFFINEVNADRVANTIKLSTNIDWGCFAQNEFKYISFKYLPFPLKKLAKIDKLNFNACKLTKNLYTWDNLQSYERMDNLKIQNNNYFQFVHISGAHPPFKYDKDFNGLGENEGSYKDGVENSIAFIEKFLKRIKDSGQYDNSAIIILADHGYNVENGNAYDGRQNPILYIKGFNEKHDLERSEKKLSQADLNEIIYVGLLDGKKSFEITKDIDPNRVRRYLYYEKYDDMYEQTLDGHAWETKKLKNTGNRYMR